MKLTTPLLPEDLRLAFPRDTRGMADGELESLLRVEERALRTQFGVIGTDAATSEALMDALLVAWPSFLQQVRQEASIQTGADSHQVTYNRAGVIDFTFPAFVGTILARVADAAEIAAAAAVTQLVR